MSPKGIMNPKQVNIIPTENEPVLSLLSNRSDDEEVEDDIYSI